MIGLLRKDLYAVGWIALLMLPLALLISLLPRMENMTTTYPMTLAFIVPMMAFAYDERCSWDRYAAMLPYRTGQIIWSKYILGYIYIVLGEATAFLGGLLQDLIRPGSVDWADTFGRSAMMLVFMVFIVAFELPTLYRFGVEKGRLVVSLILGAGLFAFLAVYMALLRAEVRMSPMVVIGMATLSITLNVISFQLSMHFYRKRQNGDYD